MGILSPVRKPIGFVWACAFAFAFALLWLNVKIPYFLFLTFVLIITQIVITHFCLFAGYLLLVGFRLNQTDKLTNFASSPLS